MTDYPTPHEIDDELLSAYLDDELSPEERSAVEARLADDPAAQEMLHHLRAVSQAVQSLPLEVVGHDLGDAVLRRVEQHQAGAKPNEHAASPAGSQPAANAIEPVSSLPGFTIGRTRRGWAWASLAIAAALLIMVLQADRKPDDQPQIARRDTETADERVPNERPTNDPLAFRPVELSEAPAPSEAEGFAMTTDALAATDSTDYVVSPLLPEVAPSVEELATNSPGGPMDPASDLGTDRQLLTTELSKKSELLSRSSAPSATVPAPSEVASDRFPASAGAATAPGAAVPESAPTLDAKQPVVVRVLTRREALGSKAFDRQLESFGIEIDNNETADASVPTLAAAPPRDLAESREQLAEGAAAPADSNQQMTREKRDENEAEYVLVDAPRPAIASFLESINQDHANYLAIEVDDNATTGSARKPETGTVAQSSPDPQGAVSVSPSPLNLQRFNRGVVAPPDADSRTRGYYFRGAEVESSGLQAGRGGEGGGYGGFGARSGVDPAPQATTPLADALEKTSLGRARRLPAWSMQSPPEGESLVRSRSEMPREQLKRGEMTQANDKVQSSATADRLQVLFVLSPADDAAPSPPARNKAE